MQWKDKCASYSLTIKKLTHRLCQVSLVVKYIWKIFYFIGFRGGGIFVTKIVFAESQSFVRFSSKYMKI